MIDEDVEVVGRALYVHSAETLVLADLHLGRDRTSAVELPVGERDDIVDRFEGLLDSLDPETVVLAGDVLHSFDRIPTGVSETLDAIVALVDGANAELVVLQGNHDTMLETLIDAPLDAEYELDDRTVVLHGHHEPTTAAKRYIVGHRHPAIRIEGRRFPCALACSEQYAEADVYVLPAFTRLAKGSLVNGRDAVGADSPLVTDLDQCRPIVPRDDETLAFPPLGSFRSLL